MLNSHLANNTTLKNTYRFVSEIIHPKIWTVNNYRKTRSKSNFKLHRVLSDNRENHIKNCAEQSRMTTHGTYIADTMTKAIIYDV